MHGRDARGKAKGKPSLRWRHLCLDLRSGQKSLRTQADDAVYSKILREKELGRPP
jgi:hypothetical protein